MRKNLKEARIAKGLTQSEVANLLKMTPNAYQKVELGERGTSVENWDALEDLMGIHQRILREKIN